MSAARQLDEIRMPLHILLENRFGDLNDNQEEMLATARTAADDAQALLERLRQVADVDRGTLRFGRNVCGSPIWSRHCCLACPPKGHTVLSR